MKDVARCARLFCLILALTLAIRPVSAAQPPISVIPQPVELKAGEGSLRITAEASIDIVGAQPGISRVALWLAATIERTYGLPISVHTTAHPTGVLVLALDPKAAVGPPQGYELDVDTQRARVVARDEAGLFYGAVTLWELLSQTDDSGALTIPVVSIRDWPRFPWRGVMLDVARHYVPPDTIKALLDGMAVHKLNVFHWHLTDDQGWRLQIRRYPQLTELGAWRTSPVASLDGHPVRYGGYYTQTEVREIVAYAAARQITVVPEIDMPGHAQAAIAALPDIGVTGRRPQVSVDWGVNPYLFAVHEPAFTFIRNVLDEVLELFPSRFIHVGGDEAIKDQWQASPAVQARLRALGLTDEGQLQSWFIERVGRYLASRQRRLIGWDEILEGGIPKSASVMSWRGTRGAIDAAKLGHDVVLSPAPTLYLDNLESRRGDEPSGRLALQSLENVYRFEPVPTQLTAQEATHVLGAQANLWTEYKRSPHEVEQAIFPRALALAELDWSPRESRDWAGFLARLPADMERVERLGLSASDSAFAADIELDTARGDALEASAARVKLSTQSSYGTLRYTLDGTIPTARSPVYDGPLTVHLGTTVLATPFDAGGRPLAAPRSRRFDVDALLSWRNDQLAACPNEDLGLRVPLDPDALDMPDTRALAEASGLPGIPDAAPVYDIDVRDACWVAPGAPLAGVTHIRVEAASLARNYALAHDENKVVTRPARTSFGELQVFSDGCSGQLVAEIPLPETVPGQEYTLSGDLQAPSGVHDLCLRFTGSRTLPMPALGRVQLRR